MPTELGPRFSATTTTSPPGMSAEDNFLWSLYQPTIIDTAEAVYFNVRLGEGQPTPEGTTPEMARMWYLNTAKRADALIEYKDRIEIVEFRDQANANAIGRLLQYALLYQQDPVIMKPLQLVLVTNRYDSDVERLSILSGIKYIVMETGEGG